MKNSNKIIIKDAKLSLTMRSDCKERSPVNPKERNILPEV